MRRTDAHVQHALLKGAISLHEAGRLDEAARIYRSIPRSDPGYCSALALLGTLHLQRGDSEEGMELIKRSLAIDPQQPTAYNNLGNTLKALKQYSDALYNYDRALALNPDFGEAWYNRGVVLNQLERYPDAIESYSRAIAVQPGYAKAFNNRGNAFKDLGRYNEALTDYDRALALRPSDPFIYSNRGSVLAALHRHDEALQSCERALEIDPNCPNAYFNLSVVYADLKRYDDALASCSRALSLKPDYLDASFLKSGIKLLLGDWSVDTWDAYELRWKAPKNARWVSRYHQRPWSGEESLAGKTILIWADQGIGDTMMAARYIPMLEGLGARVIFEVPSTLVGLISTLTQSVRGIAHGGILPEHDFQCSVMGLPRAFKTTVETIPATFPYFWTEPEKEEQWRAKLGAKEKPRIGLVWSGSGRLQLHKRPNFTRDIPFSELERAIIPSFDYFVLQRDVRPGDAAVLSRRPEVKDHRKLLETFSDTAALVAEMDLIISVDTSVAHLAGALAKPLWLLLPDPPHPFMTVLGREDCPWYPTARIFRQSKEGDWALVIDRVIEELQRPGLFT